MLDVPFQEVPDWGKNPRKGYDGGVEDLDGSWYIVSLIVPSYGAGAQHVKNASQRPPKVPRPTGAGCAVASSFLWLFCGRWVHAVNLARVREVQSGKTLAWAHGLKAEGTETDRQLLYGVRMYSTLWG